LVFSDTPADDWHLLRIDAPDLIGKQIQLSAELSFPPDVTASFYLNQAGGHNILFVDPDVNVTGPAAPVATIEKRGGRVVLTVSFFLTTGYILLGTAKHGLGRYQGDGKHQFTLHSLAFQEDAAWPAGTSNIDFVYLLALGRKPHIGELQHGEELSTHITCIANSVEFEERNARIPSLLDPAYTLIVNTTPAVIGRAYGIVLGRPPTSTEAEGWLKNDKIDLSVLAASLFGTAEFDTKYGSRKTQQLRSNLANHRLYAQAVLARQATDPRRWAKLSQLKDGALRIALEIPLYRRAPGDLRRIVDLVARATGVPVTIEPLSLSELAAHPIGSEFDLFLTSATDVRNGFVRNINFLEAAPLVTVCWLWDNHHLFKSSMEMTEHFDVVFPAHSNGHTYLHAARAIVGSVTPCAVFQWSAEESEIFYSKLTHGPRAPGPYGKFVSYPGINGLRDIFLEEAGRAIEGSDIGVIHYSENTFLGRDPADRFAEMAGYKTMICNPIFNDVPARLFDTLLVGAIPLVPHGLPDLSQSFSAEAQRHLPIITYVPDNLISLQTAVNHAITRFDEGGPSGVSQRNRVVADSHFLYHRIAAMISELITLARSAA
jgi:hypothetical protein